MLCGFFSIAGAAKKETECPFSIIRQTKNLPTCPQGWLVPETYPVGAVVISDTGGAGQESGFTAEVVTKVLTASGENNPILILPVSDDTMGRVRSRIDELPVSQELKQKYKKSLLHIKTGSFTWQQDYMQAFTNPKTGKIVLREVEGYDKLDGRAAVANSVESIVSQAKDCGITQGPPLSGTIVSGMLGGNIETLPGDVCLLGDDHFKSAKDWKEYANQVCLPGAGNRVQVPTSWLFVGHSDEVIKVVRNKNGKAPCDFSVAVASPKKALELLRKNPKDPLLDFSNIRGLQSGSLVKDRINGASGTQKLCKEIKYLREFPDIHKDSKTEQGVSQLFKIEHLLFTKAHAGGYVSDLVNNDFGCDNMTNDEVYQAFSTIPDLKIYNQVVQEKMDALKLEVAKKLKAKFPQCETDFIDFPNLFIGGAMVMNANGKYELPMGQGESLLPNPTNAISIHDTVISPDPSNTAFKKYIQEEYSKRGLKSDFVDTFEYAHKISGNLHCSTNTFHICKPRGAK